MPRITVRAADSALAMDEVLNRLGPGAYILSTRQHGGLVEIEASSDPIVEVARPTSRPQTPVIFADLLRGRIEAGGGLVPRGPAPLAPRLPDAESTTGGWGAYDADWLRALSADLDRETPKGPLAALAAMLPVQPDSWTPSRLVLTGPDPALVALTAARIATAWMQSEPGCTPQLTEPCGTVPLTETPLRGWARLLGLRLGRKIGPELAEPQVNKPELISLSAMQDPTPAHAIALAGPAGEVLLVLPTGLHPRRLARLLAPWRGSKASVCLTGIDQDVPQPEELMALAGAGLGLRLLGWGNDLLDSLALFCPQDLRAWASLWLSEAPMSEAPGLDSAASERGIPSISAPEALIPKISTSESETLA